MKIAELRAKSKEELGELVVSLKKEQFNLRMQRATGALEGQGRFKEARRTIARVKTLLNEDPNAVKAAKSPKAPKAAKESKAAAPKKEKAPAKKAKKEKE
jgi:large subunit ribosomal protein L29